MKLRETLFHILAWTLCLAFCYLGQTIRFGELQYGEGSMFLIMLTGTLYHVAVFYLAAFRYVPMWRERGLRPVLGEACLLILAALPIKSGVLYGVFRVFSPEQDPTEQFILIIQIAQVVMGLVFFIFGASFRLMRDSRTYERMRIRLEHERTAAELNYLKTQVNPHFLFNTLNNLFGLATREGAEATGESILKLADLMRYMLQETQAETVALNHELANLQNFIDLQRLRISTRHDVHIDLLHSGPHHGVHVPPMMFLPLVENAFKYGISYKAPSEITMNLAVNEEEVRFTVTNTVHHKDHQLETTSGGIGLENLRRRLALLYRGKDLLCCQETGKRFHAQLILPRIKNRQRTLAPATSAVGA